MIEGGENFHFEANADQDGYVFLKVRSSEEDFGTGVHLFPIQKDSNQLF